MLQKKEKVEQEEETQACQREVCVWGGRWLQELGRVSFAEATTKAGSRKLADRGGGQRSRRWRWEGLRQERPLLVTGHVVVQGPWREGEREGPWGLLLWVALQGSEQRSELT